MQWRPLEFDVGDRVFLKVSLTREIIRFGRHRKLSSRYIGPFNIIDGVGAMAYRLAHSPVLVGIQNFFHISHLRKHVAIDKQILDVSKIELGLDLCFEKRPVFIVDRRVKELKSHIILLILVSRIVALRVSSLGCERRTLGSDIHIYSNDIHAPIKIILFSIYLIIFCFII